MIKSTSPTWIQIRLLSGELNLVRPEIIASIVLRPERGEVVLSNFQASLHCTLESAETAAKVMAEHKTALLIIPPALK